MRHAAEHEFLDVLYGAAADPALWTQSMEMFADLVGGSSAWLSRLSVVDGSGSAITARIDPEMPRLYREHYSRLNPFSTAPDPRRYMAGWEPRVVTDEAWMHGADLVRTEYFNDFMRPQDVHGCMIVRLQSHDLEVSALTINHGRPGGGFTPQELALAERLRPHIRRAYDLTGKLGHAGLMSEAVETVLDHTSHAILILDEHLRVGRMNRAAERLVAGPDGLRVVGGRLRMPATADARRLDALLA
ncbi:MAG: hypothetical protein U1C74_15900, partial [Phenylobacterium sp.]|nr:hypothetical protein [Phenylobacterium sp.]